MLLNASHEITNCGLPQHIQERYVRYKQGNRAIVAWMTKYGPDKYKGKKTLPIKQLVALGNLLCDKIQEIGTLPSDVDFYFKEVIKERSYLSKHFREHRDQCETDEVDTINHEHFTDSLKKIHRILLTAGKPATRPKITTRIRNFAGSASSTSSLNSVQNNFQRLLLDDEILLDSSDDEVAVSDAETSATSECSHSPPEASECLCQEDESATDLLDTDGELDLAVQGIRLIQYIVSVSENIRACWTKAGCRELSVVAAAATTNVLLRQMIVHLQQNVQDDDRIDSAKAIKSRLITVSSCGEGQSLIVQRGARDMLEELINAESSIFSSEVATEVNEGEENTRITGFSLHSKILACIRSLSDRRDMPSLMIDGLACIESLDPCRERKSMLTPAACLYILTVSHSAYSDALLLPSYIALPRISALKLANEGLATLNKFINNKAVFPCQCVDTLGYRVVQMKSELERFVKHKCWDCLMQNPLVAGNHTLEILDICGYYGLHLIHYRQWSAAVLHSYQALAVLGYLDRIPILEEVSDLLAPILYTTSTRPVCGFMASWLRYIGARLKFKKGKKYQDHKDSWCMAVPAHVAARSAGLNIRSKSETSSIPAKFDYGTIDPTMRCKHAGWTLEDDVATALTGQFEMPIEADMMIQGADKSPRLLAKLSGSKSTKHKRSKSCQVVQGTTSVAHGNCVKPDHIFDASFTIDETQSRNIPACKLNLLALFYSMIQVVSGISDATHADQSNGSGRGQMCLCFVQTILRAADRVQDVRRRGGLDAKGAVLSKNEKECVECFKAQLTKVLDEAGVLHGKGCDWLWTSI